MLQSRKLGLEIEYCYNSECYGTKVLVSDTSKVKTQNIRVYIKESSIDRKGVNLEDRKHNAQIHLACWIRTRASKGLWINTVRQVLIGGPRNLATYDKGASTPHLPGQWTLSFWKSSSVQVSIVSCSFDSTLEGECGEEWNTKLWFQASWLVIFFCCL